MRFDFEPMKTDIYCDVYIIVLCVKTICIIPLLLYDIKFVNIVLGESVYQILLGSKAKDGAVEQAKYN